MVAESELELKNNPFRHQLNRDLHPSKYKSVFIKDDPKNEDFKIIESNIKVDIDRVKEASQEDDLETSYFDFDFEDNEYPF